MIAPFGHSSLDDSAKLYRDFGEGLLIQSFVKKKKEMDSPFDKPFAFGSHRGQKREERGKTLGTSLPHIRHGTPCLYFPGENQEISKSTKKRLEISVRYTKPFMREMVV